MTKVSDCNNVILTLKTVIIYRCTLRQMKRIEISPVTNVSLDTSREDAAMFTLLYGVLQELLVSVRGTKPVHISYFRSRPLDFHSHEWDKAFRTAGVLLKDL